MPYYIYDFEIVVKPTIFKIEIEFEPPLSKDELYPNAFHDETQLIISRYNTIVLAESRRQTTFQFTGCTSDDAVTQARKIQTTLQHDYAKKGTVFLSFSTLGLKEHEHIHKDMLKYKGTEEFNTIMSDYIRYLDIGEYERWLKGNITE